MEIISVMQNKIPTNGREDILGVDCETEEWTYENGSTPRTVQLKGISVAYDNDIGEYYTDPAQWPTLPTKENKVIFHHAKFDLPKLQKIGLEFPSWEDTKIAAHLLDENRKNSLKPLAASLLGKSVIEYKDLDKEDEAAFRQYAINDSLYTRELWFKLSEQLEREGLTEVYELEKALVPVIISMEDAGMKVDIKAFRKLEKLALGKLEEARKEVFKLILAEKLIGEINFDVSELNLNSSQQIGQLLYEGFNLSIPKVTKKMKPSTDKEALVALNHPVADALLQYKEYQKLLSGFLNKLPDHIINGRIHPEYNATGTVTGRFSVSNPNCQQVPQHTDLGKQLRNCFVAEKGHKLVVADYAQMELRVLAHYSKDPTLLETFRKGEDPHTNTAKKIFQTEEPTKDQRSIAKMVNFGVVYGITGPGLYRRLKALGIAVQPKDCDAFIAQYFTSHPGVQDFLDKVKHLIQNRGWVKTLYGRRRRVTAKTFREIRQACNFVIQGCSADLIKQAMVTTYPLLPVGAKIIAMIHDELIVECLTKDAVRVRETLVDAMSNSIKKLLVPLEVDAHIVRRWGDAK